MMGNGVTARTENNRQIIIAFSLCNPKRYFRLTASQT